MYPDQRFDFLGYTFRPRLSRRRRGTFRVSFSPAASDKALKAIRRTVRGAGRFTNAVTRRWTIWPGCSMRLSAAGSTTRATTSRLFIRPCGTSTGYWRDGLIGSSNLYGAWKPDEVRASRPVVPAPGGEIPPGDSPGDRVPEQRRRKEPVGGTHRSLAWPSMRARPD